MSDKNPIEQAAVFAYRFHKGNLRIALVTSLESQRWVIPKGHIEDGMTPAESAQMEAFEEAGLEGPITGEAVGTYDYIKTDIKGGGHCRVTVFPMEVEKIHKEWPEANLRAREWMSLDEAAEVVREKKLKKLMLKFAKDAGGKGHRPQALSA